MSKVTIIGGTGFVGDYLVKNLSKRGGTILKVLYRTSLPTKTISGVQYLRVDGEKDSLALKSILKETDYLIILSRPNLKLLENIVGSYLKFKKIIYASTILIYPNSSESQDENSDLIPANQYEKDKIKEESMLSGFANASGNKLTIARLTNVYGDIKNRGLIHWILLAAVNNMEFRMNNLGKPVRDFIFVEDVAKYLELLTFLPQENNVEIFNVCTGEGFSINQVVKEVEEVAGHKIKITEGEITKEKASVVGDNKKIVDVTKYKPRYNLKSGLRKSYRNYNEH